MPITLLILLFLLLGFLILWLVGFFIANDLSVPTQSLADIHHLLVIFPHPDDEVLTAGGLISELADNGRKITVVTLTKGEKGTPDAHEDPALKTIRDQELRHSAKVLGVTEVILEDFGDGELPQKEKKIRTYIDSVIGKTKPDLIVTYDLAGFYGHPDHIVVSEIVTELVQNKYKNIKLWYASVPKKLLKFITLPEHMAKDPKFRSRRALPTFKVWVGMGILSKIRSVYGYKSQFSSFVKGMPIPVIPVWFYHSLQVFEYYSKVQ